MGFALYLGRERTSSSSSPTLRLSVRPIAFGDTDRPRDSEVSCYEAATKEKRAQQSEERKLAKLGEKERKQALRDQQDGQGQMEGQNQAPEARSRIDRDDHGPTATEIDEKQAIKLYRMNKNSFIIGVGYEIRLAHKLSNVIRLRSRLKGSSRNHSQKDVSLPSMVRAVLWRRSADSGMEYHQMNQS
jgi:hypothetical protein